MPAPRYPLYPAIVACMNETRPPTRDEFRTVAARIRREAFPDMAARASTLDRCVIRAACASLGVDNPQPVLA